MILPPIPRAALNLYLRLFVRPGLARARDPVRQRLGFEATARAFPMPPGVRVRDEHVARADGSPLRLVFAGRGPTRRLVLFFHGGAFFSGSPETHRAMAARLALAAEATAVLVDYRLAPEHPFPQALDDAVCAWRAVLETAGDPRRIAVAGDSAGGNLAAALLLRLTDAGLPQPGAAVFFSPWADLTGQAASLARNARRDAMLPVERFRDAVDLYLQGHAADDPLASPVLGRFADPPPAMIFVSADEIVLDDALGLSAALERGGGDVTLVLEHGLPHAWPIFGGLLREADLSLARAGAFLDARLAP